MKLIIALLMMLITLNAYSHCGSCGTGGEEDHDHDSDHQEREKEFEDDDDLERDNEASHEDRADD